MSQNIFLLGSKGEQPVYTYYLSPANIYGLVVHDVYNNTYSVFTWSEFEGRKGMNNIASCLLRWLNYKEYYSQSYGKNHKMPGISILFDNCGSNNNNNLMIRFMNTMKEWELFGTDNFNLYKKGHTKNYCDCTFNSIKVQYRRQNVLTFEKFFENFNTSNNVEVIQILHDNVFELFLNDVCNRSDTKSVTINNFFQVQKSRHTLAIFKSSTLRQSLNIIIRRTMTTAVHRERKEL